jgi:hypothetical protein
MWSAYIVGGSVMCESAEMIGWCVMWAAKHGAGGRRKRSRGLVVFQKPRVATEQLPRERGSEATLA